MDGGGDALCDAGRLCQAADGYTLSWNGTAAALTAEDLELTATPGALYVEVNGRALYVEHGVQVRDGRIALPLEVLAEAAGLQLTWDEVEGAAWLSTDQAQPASASYRRRTCTGCPGSSRQRAGGNPCWARSRWAT